MDEEDKDEDVVHSILGEKTDKSGGLLYLVKWLGYSKPTWEPAKFVENCEALDRWLARTHATFAEAAQALVGGAGKSLN